MPGRPPNWNPKGRGMLGARRRVEADHKNRAERTHVFCPTCSERFISDEDYKAHWKATHAKVKPVKVRFDAPAD